MRVFVTGATGFVGRYLTRHLLEAEPEAEIVGTMLLPDAESADPRLTLAVCDLSAEGGEAVRKLVAEVRPDQIYHLAGAPSAANSDRQAVLNANVSTTEYLLQAVAQEAPSARVLFVSTGYVYGPCDPARPAQEDDPVQFFNVYAESKWEAEKPARKAGAVIARAFNHTGPGQGSAFVVPAFAEQIARIERGLQPPQIQVGNLDAERDFLDVRDVVRAYRLLMQPEVPQDTYNICRGEAYSLQSVLSDLLALSPEPIEVVTDPDRLRPSDIPLSLGDPTRLMRCTGWTPHLPFAQTLQETLTWWRTQ